MVKAKSSKLKAPPKVASVAYERTPDFKSVYADGSLVTVRPPTGVAILTFYEDDIVTTERTGALVSSEEGIATYELKDIVQKNIHSVHTNVRMSFDEAISLAKLIVTQVGAARPDLISKEVAKIGAPRPAKPRKRAPSK